MAAMSWRFKILSTAPKIMNIIEFIKKVPKTELHLHIEGTLEPNQMFELAKRNNIFIPFQNIQEVKSCL